MVFLSLYVTNPPRPKLSMMQLAFTLPTNSLMVLRFNLQSVSKDQDVLKDSAPLPNIDVIVGAGSTCQVYRDDA